MFNLCVELLCFSGYIHTYKYIYNVHDIALKIQILGKSSGFDWFTFITCVKAAKKKSICKLNSQIKFCV